MPGSRILAMLGLLAALLAPAAARADDRSMLKSFDFAKPAYAHPHPFATAHVVIQVSSGSPAVWTQALNNVTNILQTLGTDKVQIVVVAYGPGLMMLFHDSIMAPRIASLDAQKVEFDACHNTMLRMRKLSGHLPKLLPQAVVVPGGVIRIMQLEQHGFVYLKP
ncbi:MAG: DsrE family protein [Acetobacteraceae bacterium]